MKRAIAFCIITLLPITTCMASTLLINFDTYVSPTNNDYLLNFTDPHETAPFYFVQQTSGGITGGSLVPSNYGDYWNDSIILRRDILNGIGKMQKASVCFKYDSSLINPNRNNKTIGIMFGADHDISVQIRGTGNDHSLQITSYYATAGSDCESGLGLISGNWYKLELTIAVIGGSFGDYLIITGTLNSLGPNGLGTPQLLCTSNLELNDIFFASSPNLICILLPSVGVVLTF